MCGPFAVLMSYISEFHGLKHRSRVMMYTGIFFSLASIILPLLAWIIIPNPAWKIKFVAYSLGKFLRTEFEHINLNFKFLVELRTWQSFLLVCSLPSIISGLLVAFLLPESPKFLMSRGRNHAAMEIFIKIHRMNYGPNVEYPVSDFQQNLIAPDVSIFVWKIFAD